MEVGPRAVHGKKPELTELVARTHSVHIHEKGANMHFRYTVAILSLSLAVASLMPETAFGQRRGGSGGSGASRGYYGGAGGYYGGSGYGYSGYGGGGYYPGSYYGYSGYSGYSGYYP